MTDAAKALLQDIPDELAQEIIEAAGDISGTDPGALTLEQAADIVTGDFNDDAEYLQIVIDYYHSWKRRRNISAKGPDGERLIISERGPAAKDLIKQIKDQTTLDDYLLAEQTKKRQETGIPPLRGATDPTVSAIKQTVNNILEAAGVVSDIAQTAATAAGVAQATAKAAAETVANIQDILRPAMYGLSEFFNSIGWETVLRIGELYNEAQSLEEYINEELKKPKYGGQTLDEIFDALEVDENGVPKADSLAMQAIEAARAAREAANKEAETVIAKKTENIIYPLDKINANVWNLLEEDTHGQIFFNLAPTGTKRDNILATYSINFDGLQDVEIIKRLTPFDKRVYVAAGAVWNAGNDVTTLSQIHYAMGNTNKKPATHQLQKINDSLTKMQNAVITLDNRLEAEALKGRDHFQYDGYLLPFERVTRIVNGQVTDAAVHLFREPPLLSFAKQRKQVTTIGVKLLQSPASKTDANLLIEDYLIDRISRAKKSAEKSKARVKSHKIRYETLYKHAEITTPKQKRRAPEKIETYLKYYKQEGFITHYKMDSNGSGGFTIFWE